MTEQWYWCLTHQRAEPSGSSCRADDRMGPYESREAAVQWKERFSAREEDEEQAEEEAKDDWDREDEAWDAWPDEES